MTKTYVRTALPSTLKQALAQEISDSGTFLRVCDIIERHLKKTAELATSPAQLPLNLPVLVKKTRPHPLPADWRPKPEHYAKGPAAWVDERAAEMRAWCDAEGHRSITLKSNWDQAFHNWLRKDARHGRRPPQAPASSRSVGNALKEQLAFIHSGGRVFVRR